MAVSDYFVNLGDPFERSINAFRGGYSDAKAMVGDAERRDERARLVEARQAGTAAMQSLAALGGNATAQDYRVAAAANPEMAAAIQAQGKLVGSERSANDLRAAQGLFVALASPDAGEVIPAQLEKRIAAAEASGDKQTADAARAMLLTYGKPGGANALRVALGVSLSGGMPAGQFNYLVGEVYPKADLTDATKARLEQARLAGLTEGTAAFNRFMLTGKTGEGAEPGSDPKSPLGKVARDVRDGLIPPSALEDALRIQQQAAESGGKLTQQQIMSEEARLRVEYLKSAQALRDAELGYSTLESSASQASGPGDVALITSFMKMLDPGSVVRESEFATARDTGGLYTRLRNSLSKAEQGQFLQPKQRAEFVSLAKLYLDAANEQEILMYQDKAEIAANYGLNPRSIFGSRRIGQANAPTPLTAATIPKSFLEDPNIVNMAAKYNLNPESIWEKLSPEQRAPYAQ
tara:strand:- start:474 stop:1865 length:1392 start_codon:yes stop_codon:yes gene_type:complete